MGFETKDHIADQERLSKLFVGEWGGEAIKTPMYWPFDYVIQRNSKTYVVECRQRYNEHDLYPTLNLAVKKWQSLQFAKRLVSGVFLVIGWSDGWGWLEVDGQSYRVSFGGRSLEYIRVTGDREYMVEIPLRDFKFRQYESRKPRAEYRTADAIGTFRKSVPNMWTPEEKGKVVFGD